MKWLKISRKIGTLRCKDARSQHSKYNITQKSVPSKLISTCPEGQFQRFFEKSKYLELYSDLEPKIFGRVVNTAFYCSEEHFCRKTQKKI